MARKKVVVAQNKTLTVGGEDKDGKEYPPKYEGNYVGERQEGRNKWGKPTIIHYFLTPRGLERVYGRSTLNPQLRSVPKGAMTYIDYKGLKKQPNGNRAHVYEVEVDEDLMVSTKDIVLPESYDVSAQAQENYENDNTDTLVATAYEESEEDEVTAPEPLKNLDKSSQAARRALRDDLLNRNKTQAKT